MSVFALQPPTPLWGRHRRSAQCEIDWTVGRGFVEPTLHWPADTRIQVFEVGFVTAIGLSLVMVEDDNHGGVLAALLLEVNHW